MSIREVLSDQTPNLIDHDPSYLVEKASINYNFFPISVYASMRPSFLMKLGESSLGFHLMLLEDELSYSGRTGGNAYDSPSDIALK
jgi:hypothetical protein